MIRTSRRTPMLDVLRTAGLFESHPLVLVDVGCRGGVSRSWSRFGPSLIAHGFDPVIDECERLSAQETRSGVQYHPTWIGLPVDDPFVLRAAEDDIPGLNPWSRLSTSRWLERPGAIAPLEAAPPRVASPAARVGIADFARAAGLPPVDFIKIDVDGADYEVLRSAERLLDRGEVLGIAIEVNYWGGEGAGANTFHNIDRYLRGQGFVLFGLDTRLYSRADLPAPFVTTAPAHTAFGAPLQGNALYFRDLAAPDARATSASRGAPTLLKHAALYELFALPDCAAEIINVFREEIARIADPTALLDALVTGLDHAPASSYADYQRRFSGRDGSFFAGQTAEPQHARAPVVTTPARNQRLEHALERERHRAAELAASRDRLKRRLARRNRATAASRLSWLRTLLTRIRPSRSSLPPTSPADPPA